MKMHHSSYKIHNIGTRCPTEDLGYLLEMLKMIKFCLFFFIYETPQEFGFRTVDKYFIF